MTIQIPASGKVIFGGQSKIVIKPSQVPITAEGGSIIDVNINNAVYRTHTFTGIGTFTITSAGDDVATVEYIAVAGGGGGGGGSNNFQGYLGGGGGGGAGGFLSGILTLPVGSYTIDVGAGGAATVNGNPTKIINDLLSTDIIECIGGGRGGSGGQPGSTGGSGGGNGLSFSPPAPALEGGLGTPGQGFPGGGPGKPSGGGGGGATQAGFPQYVGAEGGSGKESFITGFPQFYAGGGGAGSPTGSLGGSGVGGRGGNPADRTGNDGSLYTGSGGGGGQGPSPGGNGSGGIVIIRYRIA